MFVFGSSQKYWIISCFATLNGKSRKYSSTLSVEWLVSRWKYIICLLSLFVLHRLQEYIYSLSGQSDGSLSNNMKKANFFHLSGISEMWSILKYCVWFWWNTVFQGQKYFRSFGLLVTEWLREAHLLSYWWEAGFLPTFLTEDKNVVSQSAS